MKKATKKAINQALPNLTSLKRMYIHSNYIFDGQQTFHCAFADYDDGDVDITTYAYGDAMKKKHYYKYDTTNISDIISDWIEGNIDRREVIDAIRAAMIETMEG